MISATLQLVRKNQWFFLILLIASALRLGYLGSIPAGLSWDEAAIGYNGFGITTVHRDEWLERMPITFKSFGDYKAPVAIYLSAISTLMLGLNSFAIRLPMALAGIATAVAVYFIAKEIFIKRSQALLAMGLIAVSPLNIHFSRIAFESGIAVACTSIGFALLLHARRVKWFYLPAALFFVLSVYAYHSTKFSTPLFLLVYVIVYRSTILRHMKWVLISSILAIVLLFPLIRASVQGNAAERLFMTSSILEQGQVKPLHETVPIVISNTVRHFYPSFLFFGETDTLRHGNGSFGILGYVDGVLFIVGIFALISQPAYRKHRWLLIMILIAILPAAISDVVPHSNRAHGVIPWMQFVAVFGIGYLERYVPKKHFKYGTALLLAAFAIQLLWQGGVYKNVYSVRAAPDFQYGYKEAVMYARSREGTVDKVLFTSAYGQPYIYILLYKRLNPIQYQQGALANYEIRDIKWDSDKTKERTLVVGTPEEIPADDPNIVHEIFLPDGSPVFRIVEL